MKLFVFWIAFLLMIANPLLAQINQSKVSYICSTKLSNGSAHDGLNTLYFTQGKGLFIHNDYPKENKYLDRGNATIYIVGDPEGLPVFMNLDKKYLYYKTTYGLTAGAFIIKENLQNIKWEIQTETKKIERFNCIKAVGEFGGRIYDVWFTPDIPVSLGPYKLWGLPGMILEAKSRDGRVSYEFKEYESPISNKVKLEKPTIGQEVTWEELKTHIINRLLKAESLSTDQYTITNDDPAPDYHIERNKYTIISEYKKDRAAKQKKN